MAKLPIVILNWNGLSDTIECVESVLLQSDEDFVVYLIDNASQNDEFQKLQERYWNNSNIILIQNSTNLGFGKAHNLIFDQLIAEDYESVALINNDAVANVNWLSKAKQTMSKSKADIVACKMIEYSTRSKLDSAGLIMLNTGEILPRGHGKSAALYKIDDEVISFCAGACLIKLDTIKELGGFDDYFSTGYEDAELGLRAYMAGRRIVYSAHSVVYHKMGQSLNKVKSYSRTRKIQQDVNYSYLKNMPLSIIILNFPFYVLRLALVLILHILTLRFRYPIIWFDAIFRTFVTDGVRICKKRKEVQHQRGIIEGLRAQKFFLFHDLMRFNRFFVKGNKHKFEQK